MITGKILKHNGWPEGRIIGLAKKAAEQLSGTGLEHDAILARLDAVRAQPGDFLSDAMLGDLARECLRHFAPQPDRRRMTPCGPKRCRIASGAASTSTTARWRRWRPRCVCRSRRRAR